jgi:opacity protein-like surface antigen
MLKTTHQLLALVLLMAAAVNGFAQENAFAQGTAAFKAGHYEQALNHFDKAKAEGNTSANLIYNRAVTLYRLQRLNEARDEFSKLTDNAQWRDLARYNLGLIAQTQGDDGAAQFWFAQVAAESTNPKLQQLAQTRLASLAERAETPARPGKKGALLFNIGVTSDSNAANLADELSARSSGAADIYVDSLLYGHYYIQGQRHAGTRLYGLAYMRDFQEYDAFNATIVGAGFIREGSLESVNTEWGLRAIRTQVDSRHLTDQMTLSAAVHRPLESGRLSAAYQSSYFDAGEAYRHIGGWQHQLQLSWRHIHNRLTITPRVRWQKNSRENKQTEAASYSYSPTTLSLMTDLSWQLTPAWTLQGGIAWSRSEYSGKNRATDLDGVVREQRRETTQSRWSMGASYSLSPRWRLSGEYSYTDTDDNFDLYSYDKRVLGAKLEYVFD